MQHIELTVKGLSYSQGKSGAYALILAEVGEGGRKLPVVIGGAEAQSIAVAMEKSVAPPRPLTHGIWVVTGGSAAGRLNSSCPASMRARHLARSAWCRRRNKPTIT